MLRSKQIGLFISLSSLISFSQISTATSLVNIFNSGSGLVREAILQQPMNAQDIISFNVWLTPRHKKELDQLTQDIYNPYSSRYQQFLTSISYEQRYAPSKLMEEKVRNFFSSFGLDARVINHHVQVKGTVKQVNKSLDVAMHYYKYQGATFYANSHSPKLPSDLAAIVLGISGLNILPEPHSDRIASTATDNVAEELHFNWNTWQPTAIPTTQSLSGFTGAQLQTTYNITNIAPINGQVINGQGQTLVIVDKCGSNTSQNILNDANLYFMLNAITPFIETGPLQNFSIITPLGTPYSRCSSSSAYSREIQLDIESSHTLAPGSNTVLVLGDNGQQDALMQVIASLISNQYQIAGFANAYVISNSWGGAEQGGNSLLEYSLELAAAHGISVNFSSGDCGDNTYDDHKKCQYSSSSALTVNYPASSAYVTAVGATSLFVNTTYRYAFETVWGSVKTIDNVLSYDGGTGGGVSTLYGSGSWQNSLAGFSAGGYGIVGQYIGYRALPDIAMLGDPETGLWIVSQGNLVKDGGTSLACPLFSATMVLVNQARALLHNPRLGQAAPYLYQMNQTLLANRALNLIIPPALIISGATPPPATSINNIPAPASAFTIGDKTFGWDSALTVEPEDQYWNDAVGVGSPNIPNFVSVMATL